MPTSIALQWFNGGGLCFRIVADAKRVLCVEMRLFFFCQLIANASRTFGDGTFGNWRCLLWNGSDLLKHKI